MGANMPKSPQIDALQWIENHLAVWTNIPASIGLTLPQVTAATTKAVAARVAFDAAETARDGSKAATLTWNQALEEVRESVQGLLNIIKGFAEHTGNDAVYAIAQISPQSPPRPSPAPQTPESLKVLLTNMGVVNVSWTGTLAGRTFYEVQRSFADTPIEGDWQALASVANRFFEDSTLPNGTPKAHYRVRAVRGPGGAGSFNDATRYSGWATALLVLGAGDAAGPVVQKVSGPQVKLAA